MISLLLLAWTWRRIDGGVRIRPARPCFGTSCPQARGVSTMGRAVACMHGCHGGLWLRTSLGSWARGPRSHGWPHRTPVRHSVPQGRKEGRRRRGGDCQCGSATDDALRTIKTIDSWPFWLGIAHERAGREDVLRSLIVDAVSSLSSASSGPVASRPAAAGAVPGLVNCGVPASGGGAQRPGRLSPHRCE